MTHADVLESFRRALTLETHHLVQEPDLLVQQLQNRLQWEGEEVRAVLDRGHIGRRRKAVIRMKTHRREARALKMTIEAHRGVVEDCAIDPGSGYVVSVGSDGAARQWDPRTGQMMLSVPIAEPGTRTAFEFTSGTACCAISPDGGFVVCGGAFGSVCIWDSLSGAVIWSVDESAYTVNTCAVLPGASAVVWTRVDSRSELTKFPESVLRVRASDGQERTIKVGGYIRACVPSPDAGLLAIAGDDGFAGHVEVRNARTLVPLWRSEHPPESTVELDGEQVGFAPKIADCSFAPDTAYVVTAAADSSLRMWNARSGTPNGTLSGGSGFLERRSDFRRTQTPVAQQSACVVTPDGESILAGSHGGDLMLWDVTTLEPVARLEGHGAAVTRCAVAPDGSFAVSAGHDGTLRVWDMAIVRGG